MRRYFGPILAAAAVAALPAAAQAPPTASQPAQQARPAQTGQAPVPLPQWFVEIDTAKKGEVSRADFVKYRMKSFDELDANKDGKVALDEFLKLAEPPHSSGSPGGPGVEERRNRLRAEFQSLDVNRDGFFDRAEAESLIHSEFSRYDTDRDNKVTEPEVRLIVQRALAREAAERQQAEAGRRTGMMAINDLIDVHLLEADKLDKNGDGKLSQEEYIVQAGPADGPQTQGMPPYDLRRQIVMRKFQQIDANKDGQLDRAELTGYAVRQFLDMDTNKDRFVSEEELKKAAEVENSKVRELLPAQPAPAPAQPRPAQPQPAPPAPAAPRGTR